MFYVSYSYQLALISIFTFIIMLIIAKPWRTYFNPQSNNERKNIRVFFWLYVSTCIFAFWEADTYHSWEGFIEARFYDNYRIGAYEEVYNWLAGISGNNYFLWRTYIWLPACLFLFVTASRLGLLHRNMLLAMALFGSMLSFTRGMLGHTMLLFGAVLLVDKNSKIAIKFIGLMLFCLSYYFHKSMYVNIAFALLAFYPFNKKSFVVSLIVFPFLVVVATKFVDGIVSGGVSIALGENVGGAGDRTALYASAEKAKATFLGKIANVVIWLPEYVALLYLVNRVLYKQYFKGIRSERVFIYLFRLTYIAMYVASLFAFVETSSFIYSRFKYMAYFQLVFFHPVGNLVHAFAFIFQLYGIMHRHSLAERGAESINHRYFSFGETLAVIFSRVHYILICSGKSR